MARKSRRRRKHYPKPTTVHDPRNGLSREELTPTRQHLTPRSRGGPTEPWNILRDFPRKLHEAWNILFGNLNLFEALAVFVNHLTKAGKFRNYQKFVREGEKPPKTPSPDDLLLAIIKRIFPEDWVPGDQLIKELERRRNGSTKLTINVKSPDIRS